MKSAYRQPINTIQSRPRSLSALWALGLVPLGVALVAVGVWLRIAVHLNLGRIAPLGVVLLFVGVILPGKHLYATWRARRNARLELQWEKWLESADSCQVGPRKWTK